MPVRGGVSFWSRHNRETAATEVAPEDLFPLFNYNHLIWDGQTYVPARTNPFEASAPKDLEFVAACEQLA